MYSQNWWLLTGDAKYEGGLLERLSDFYSELVCVWPILAMKNYSWAKQQRNKTKSLFLLDTTWQVDQDVNPDDLEDRAFPHKEQSPEDAVNSTTCVGIPVAVDLSARQLGLNKWHYVIRISFSVFQPLPRWRNMTAFFITSSPYLKIENMPALAYILNPNMPPFR